MPERPESRTELTVRNDVAELAILRDALERVGSTHGLATKPLVQLQAALDEVASNIIKYAWPDGGGHEIRVCISVGSGQVQVEISDDGMAFDPLAVPPPSQPWPGKRPRPGAVGIRMLKGLVEKIEYTRIEGRNYLTLTKQYGSAKEMEQKSMTVGSLAITEIRSGPACILALAGRIDSTNTEQLVEHLNELFGAGEKHLVLDFKEVLYLTSAAFRVLLVATDEAERNRARFSLCGVLGQVKELFEIGGMLDAFVIHASREEALAQPRQG